MDKNGDAASFQKTSCVPVLVHLPSGKRTPSVVSLPMDIMSGRVLLALSSLSLAQRLEQIAPRCREGGEKAAEGADDGGEAESGEDR